MKKDTQSPATVTVEVIDAPGATGRARATGMAVMDIASTDLSKGLAEISKAVAAAMKDASPDTWAVEFNVGFKAGLKVPVLVSAEASAALKITLNWKKAAA